MITALIIIGQVVGYFAIGAVIGRYVYGLVYRRGDSMADMDAAWMAWLTVIFWPASPLALIAFWVHQWFQAPIKRDRAHADQLREDARRWETKQYTGTQAEREMAAELARVLRERAREVDV